MRVVLALILSALAAWVGSSILESRNRSLQKRTMADMRTIATAWEARVLDRKRYGTGSTPRIPAAELAQALQPTYIKRMPQRDGWGGEYEFRANDASQSYSIRSFGSDGKADDGAGGPVDSGRFELDLIFGNGTFVQYPEGT